MKLLVTTPIEVVLDRHDVVHVRAEDETGAFGILPGHADFLTALEIGVVAWRDADHHEGYVAVRGGVLRVSGGSRVAMKGTKGSGSRRMASLICWAMPVTTSSRTAWRGPATIRGRRITSQHTATATAMMPQVVTTGSLTGTGPT